MSDRRELVEQILGKVHYWLADAQPHRELARERDARCYSYLHCASLAIGAPIIDSVAGFVAEVLDGQAITDISEHEFARLAADHLYSLAKVSA